MSDSHPQHELWIGGRETSPANGEYFENRRPLDDSRNSLAAKGSPEDVDAAVESAHAAFEAFRKTTPSEREGCLLNAATLLQQQADEFINILIDEVGSPIVKARKEITTAVGILRAAAGATRNLTGKTLPTDVPGRLSISLRQPLGVIAGVTPFNVPLIKNVKHAAMPLATGNTFVLLPSEEAPVMAIRVARLFHDAGFPDGVFNVVTGSGREIGDSLTKHPLVRMVGFTGSARVGRHVGGLCGSLGKRFTLEMGGKNPLVILRDADLTKAVQGSVIGSFLYQGQICMASSRIYVERQIHDEFLERFCAAVANLQHRELRDDRTMIGPIINERQRERVRSHLDDAVAQGATLLTGGRWHANVCEPTILTGVTESMKIYSEETFGPLTSVFCVDSAGEALARANDSEFGLSGSVYTSDLTLAMKFVEEMNVGMVHVNGTTIQDEPHVPFGGVGASGFGRESTDTDIDAMTEWKWATIQHS